VLQPGLYQGGRPAFDDAFAARLPFRKGEIRTIVDLPAGVSALRIDSADPDVPFTLNDLKIVEIGKTMLALFWLKTWVMTALSDRARRAELVARLKDGLRRKGPQALMQRLTGVSSSLAYDEWIDAYDILTQVDRARIADRIAAMTDPPLISVIMPCYNSPEKWLRRAIESVMEQLYPHWELCIADDASGPPHVRAVVEEYARRDSRIKATFRAENGHIARATNSALALATGRYVALLDHDDEYRPHALYMVAEELATYPDAEVIYSDEDKLDERGKRFDPYFKTDFSPDLMLSHNYLAHLIVYSRALIEKIGGFRVGFEGSQDYDLALRCLDASRPERVRHIPFILYHWRAIAGSVALSGDQKSYAHEAARRAIAEHLARIDAKGAQVVGEESGTMHRVTYPLPAEPPKVTVIIPTRDRVVLLVVCVTGLLEKTDYPNWELVIVDNGSIERETHEFFSRLKGDPRIRVVFYGHPFNYSAINNLGARHATGELLCLLNNDIEPISPGWLSEMVSHALRPGIGAVGAKLYYAHDAIQHAGVVTGIGGVAGHFEKHLSRKEFGYFRRPGLIQNFSAVTAACLVVRRAAFEDVGGLDEHNLTVAFNDVDFCLRLRERGYLNVWTPHAELYHYESASRGYEDSPEKITRFVAEETYMKRRWGKALLADPYYNPNLSLLHEQVRLAFPPRVTKPWKQAATG
jgi:GT2 family glycosyltransferase